jgi:HD-like signal output (HDOD) protein
MNAATPVRGSPGSDRSDRSRRRGADPAGCRSAGPLFARSPPTVQWHHGIRPVPSAHPTPLAIPEPLQRIRNALREDAALPALGQSVATVSRMADGDSDTVEQLAQVILSDVSLTQRLLRCANSPLYRTRDSAPVTTVSRALVLLGFDQIRSLALSMMLVDRLVPGNRAGPVMRAFAQALGAASVARCTLQRCWPSCAEEAAIAALFRNIGRVIASVHAPEETAAIRAEVAAGIPEPQAARALIGRSFEDLTQEVVASWGLPQRIGQALKACPPRPTGPRLSIDWVLIASAFGDEAASLYRRYGPQGWERTATALSRKYGEALGLDADAIGKILLQSHQETQELAQALGMGVLHDTGPSEVREPSDADGPAAPMLADGGADADEPASGTRVAVTAAAGNPRLLSSMSRIAEALAGSYGIHRVVQIATEGLRAALSSRRAVYFARDDAASAFRPRAGDGCDIANLRSRIAIPVQYAPDLIHAAIARGADLHIADVEAESVRGRLPQWLLPTFPDARAFLVLPVMIDGRPTGFFYADHDEPAQSPPTPAQVDAIRQLRNQVVLAMRTAPAAAR